jgi:hypothetical protein
MQSCNYFVKKQTIILYYKTTTYNVLLERTKFDSNNKSMQHHQFY